MKLTGVLAPLSALLLVALAGCGSDSSSDPADTVPGKFDQTWVATYSDTTCADWNNKLDDHQQWVAAADMLSGARNSGDGGAGMPSDALITEFQSGITTACVVPSMSLSDAGVGLYLTDRARFRP